MDLFFEAISLYRRRIYDQCIEKCNTLLQKNALQQGPWELKMRAMTQRVYIDDIEANDGVIGTFSRISYEFNAFGSCEFCVYNGNVYRYITRIGIENDQQKKMGLEFRLRFFFCIYCPAGKVHPTQVDNDE